jgi:hypothetical protein
MNNTVEVYKEKLGEVYNNSFCWRIKINGRTINNFWDARDKAIAECFAMGIGEGLSWAHSEDTVVSLTGGISEYFAGGK